ncbi:MAG: porin [Proteobacteria bacterium]|uniref:Porin n=1 Tax=Candidatus Avisuccinivibrio stercorigallinarum TaxID=2840704 RepID=A0A9D9GMY4_9GAMM|nr:porin [Candidatus Avisuccinivibrio stercorigallinarum]
MNKSILALAVAAVAAASVAQAATVYDRDGTSLAVYGRVQSVLYSADTGNTDAQGDYGDNSIDTSARLGLDMRSTINQYVAVFGKAEWEAANGDDGEGGDDDFNGRYLWVGADFGMFGSLKAGKFEDAIKFAISPTDIFEDFGCVAQLGNDDRRAGQIMYEWNGYGVDVKLSGQTANNNQQVDGAYWAGERLDINSGFAAALGYTSPDVLFGPIGIRAGYSYAQFQDEAGKAGLVDGYDDYNQWAASLSWGGSTGFYTAVMYSDRDFTMFDTAAVNDYSVSGVEFVLRYTFQNGMSIFGGYQYQNIDEDGSKGVDYDASVVNLEFDWQVTPNFKVWTEARWDVDTDEGYDTWTKGVTNYEEDVYSVGARYTF